MSRSSVGRFVEVCCGGLLLAAVALKIQGMSAGDVGQTLTMFSPGVQSVTLQVEALVGLWLVSGYVRQAAWLAGVSLFALLAGVSVYLAATGQPSCGCFGRVQVSPWASLALDVACVTGLLLTRPQQASPGYRHLIQPIIWSAVIFALILASSSQTASRQFARLRGEQLLVEADVDAGSGVKGETQVVLVRVQNIGNSPVQLLGGTATCACVATDDLPLTIQPGESLQLPVSFKFSGEPGNFKHTFMWYTDAPGQPRVAGTIVGRVERGS